MIINGTVIDRRYRSIAERNFDVTCGLHHFAIGWNEPQSIDRIGNRDMAPLIVLITDHRSEMSFVGQMDSLHAEAGAENSIERGGRAAALQMPEHTGARLFASALSDLPRYDIADAAKTEFAVFTRTHDLLTIFGSRAFRNDHERAEIARRITFLDRGRNFIVIKRDLRN